MLTDSNELADVSAVHDRTSPVGPTGSGSSPTAVPLHSWKAPYRLSHDAQFRLPFPRRLDLRWAILLPRDLIYPFAIEKALRKFRCKHVLDEAARCAGFALGLSRVESLGPVWYVTTLQSDLAFASSSCLRDYLRGWRSVLFSSILLDARRQGIAAVALPPAEAVAKAALWGLSRSQTGPPASWRNIYDRTADEFGMPLQRLRQPVNIQVVPRRRRVMHDWFFIKRVL